MNPVARQTGKEHFPTLLTGTGAEFDNKVSGLDDIGVVLDGIDCVAGIYHLFKKVNQVSHIAQV